jgi:Zn-dependent peptidase ImmA (M78 family)
MPDKAIIDRLKYTVLMTSPNDVVNEFAKTFAVSPEALRIRLKTFKKEHPSVWNEYKMEEKLF